MDTTQTQTPAQAAVTALENRAQNGEKVTARELAEARAEVDLEIFAAEAASRAEVERLARERAQKIADINKQVETMKAEKTLKVAREKLAAAMEDFGRVCGDYEARRLAIVGRTANFPGMIREKI